jgi:bidirectional [NiFe] hydrogenase diaphorase subunit
MSGACLRICTAASCRSRGAETLRQRCSALLESANSASATQGVAGRDVTVKGVGCLGPCSEGPLLAVDDAAGGSRLFSLVANGQAGSAAVIEVVIKAVAADLHTAVADGDSSALAQWSPPHSREIPADDPFLALQLRRVLAQCGRIDPAEIADALAAGAYRQLQAELRRNDPAGVIELVRRSGLRGRGGAGYPTGLKWATVAAMPGGEKVVVCNADEGDPGAFMDRTVLEGDPHTLLEGMAIAAHAVGADRGFIYVRAEYPLAIERLRIALAQAEQHGWLGTALAGSDFSFHVELRVGAGAYVCGEETALIHSIEGQRGVPRPRPPYPAQRGVFGLPTLINNVETFANIPALLRLGPEAYAPGTKVFSLTGQVRRSGVLEVPMGTPLRTIVETMGGGAPAGRRIKAVQTGGPSGGCVPASALDTPVNDESLQTLGTIMGSGGMVVLDDTTNMVDIAAFFMAFSREESCGKCIPCRSGTVQLEMLLRKLLSRQAGELDLAQLERLCPVVSEASLCGLGQSAPRPVLSTLRHFRGDYLALLETTPAAPPQEQHA